ncbi:MAG TPA: fibrinogen-like YCDxxxxGGGW domain-containing protein [Labilithrix sp.]|nr:fibrinogen-like YCDxxxxGGGW domain-containing protein [Labilithrix sp.]
MATKRRLLRSLSCLLVAGVAGLSSCREATALRVRVYTDVAWDSGRSIVLAAGAAPTPAEPSGEIQGPWSEPALGDLVFLPGGDKSRELRVLVVMGIGKDPRTCTVESPQGCVFARRKLAFVPHRTLTLPINVYSACVGVPCGEDTTCSALGECIPASIDTDDCASTAGCFLPGESELATLTEPDAGAVTEPETDAGLSSDAAPPIDHCSPNPCENGGICQNGASNFSCSCPGSFEGETCSSLAGSTCLELRRKGRTTSGVYTVAPASPDAGSPYPVYCDMTTDGGGWTLVSNRQETAFVGTWGTTSVNAETPSRESEYVLDFENKLPPAGDFFMRYEPTGTQFQHAFVAGSSWATAGVGRRRALATFTGYLHLGTGTYGGSSAPDTTCVMSGVNNDCDGNYGKIQGQGLFNRYAADELPPCSGGQAGWKPRTGTDFTDVVCAPPGYVSIYFREALASCEELRALGGTTPGTYTIDPDGNGPAAPSNEACP